MSASRSSIKETSKADSKIKSQRVPCSTFSPSSSPDKVQHQRILAKFELDRQAHQQWVEEMYGSDQHFTGSEEEGKQGKYTPPLTILEEECRQWVCDDSAWMVRLCRTKKEVGQRCPHCKQF